MFLLFLALRKSEKFFLQFRTQNKKMHVGKVSSKVLSFLESHFCGALKLSKCSWAVNCRDSWQSILYHQCNLAFALHQIACFAIYISKCICFARKPGFLRADINKSKWNISGGLLSLQNSNFRVSREGILSQCHAPLSLDQRSH